jgi:uncharacterized OsmC-like protein
MVVVPVEASWQGGTLVEARMGETRLLMDAPPFESRESQGPSATETYLAAIGRCYVMSIIKAAKAEGVIIHGLQAKLFGAIKQTQLSSEARGSRRFQNISVDLELETNATEDQIAKVLQTRLNYSLIVNAIKDGIAGELRHITVTPRESEISRF